MDSAKSQNSVATKVFRFPKVCRLLSMNKYYFQNWPNANA